MKKSQVNWRFELGFELDLIKDNINRMCITDSLDELSSMQDHAMRRINRIFEYNQQRLLESEEDS